MRIPSGVTDQYLYFVAVDATDFTTRETALTGVTVYRSRNGAAAAAMTPTVAAVDATNMPGVFSLLLDEDMTIGAGNDSEEMCFHIESNEAAPVTRTIELYRPKITAGNTLGVAADGDISGNVDGNVDGSVANVSGAVGSVTAAIVLPTIPANWITAAGINASALDDKGNWNVGKTGYSLTQAFPSNFAAMSITAGGLVDITQAAADKAWGTATRALTALGFTFVAGDFGAASLNGKGDWNVGKTGYTLTTQDWNVGKTGYSISGAKTTLDALNDIAVADIVGAALTELASVPAATPTLGQAIMLPYMSIRNKRDTTASDDEIHNSAGAVIGTAPVSDDTVTFVKGKYV